MCSIKTRKMEEKVIVGFDCGNSSYRVVVGRYDGNLIKTEVIEQIPNEMVKVGNYYYWDILKIFTDFKKILKEMIRKGIHIDSIGICTWGVDFALFDKNGCMIGNPLAYRNEIGGREIEKMSDDERNKMFQETGILSDKINSVYMLKGMKRKMSEMFLAGEKLLMVPDILNYMMTGVMINEPSELSTTQIFDTKKMQISKEICNMMGISETLFSNIGTHGALIGNVLKEIRKEIGADYEIPVICVPSHDTAAAVAAIPAMEEDFIFISSGTWSLIGTELEKPMVNENVKNASLTNEVGAFEKITLLKNSMGMFMIQQIRKEYEVAHKKSITWDEIVDIAKTCNENEVYKIDINSERLFNPLKMSDEIWKMICEKSGLQGEISWNMVIRAVYESMAENYAVTFSQIENVTGKKYKKIYIVGGGVQNSFLNQLTAEKTGKTVIACRGESTALGNIAVQLKFFDDSLSLKTIRKIISKSIEWKSFVSIS